MAASSLPTDLDSLKRRLYARVAVDGDCIVFMGCKADGQYGHIRESDGGKMILAHRAAWMIHAGEIPDGLRVLHTCDNPPCINMEHLFIGTQRDNVHDMINKGRAVNPRGDKNGSRLHP